MSSCVLVCSDEAHPHDGVELPTEMDGTLLLSIVQSQFDKATGLKYRNQTTGAWRAVRVMDGVLYPPENGWGDLVYVAVSLKPEAEEAAGGDSGKRKMAVGDSIVSERAAKNPRSTSPDAQREGDSGGQYGSEDLIVLGLEWSVTDGELRKYFEQFGDLRIAEVKKDMVTGRSRGFGFIRFADPKLQYEVYEKKHVINGRRVDLSYSRKSASYLPCKIFVGCLPLKDEVTKDDLKEYFGAYGALSDVYIPRPYRGFGFVTFQDGQVAMKVMSTKHQLKGSTLNLTVAEPKNASHGHTHRPGGMGMGGGGEGGGGGHPHSHHHHHHQNAAMFYDMASRQAAAAAAVSSAYMFPQAAAAGAYMPHEMGDGYQQFPPAGPHHHMTAYQHPPPTGATPTNSYGTSPAPPSSSSSNYARGTGGGGGTHESQHHYAGGGGGGAGGSGGPAPGSPYSGDSGYVPPQYQAAPGGPSSHGGGGGGRGGYEAGGSRMGGTTYESAAVGYHGRGGGRGGGHGYDPNRQYEAPPRW